MIIIGVILIFVLGFLIINLIDSKVSLLEKIFTGFLISSGISTFSWFLISTIVNRFDLKITLLFMFFAILLFLILNLVFKKFEALFSRKPILRISRIQFAIITFILIAVVSSFLANSYWPVRDWDALTLYDFRGKFFASQNSIRSVFDIHRYYLGYPLYTSLLHSYVYLLNTNGNPLFMYTLIYVSFITITYSVLTRISSSKISLLFTFIIAFTFEIFDHSLLSYTNLPYSTFLIAGYLYFLNYIKDKKMSYLIIASVLIGLSGWIRNSDPFWIPPVLLMIYQSIKDRKIKHLLLFVTIILIIRLPWSAFTNEVSKNYLISSSNNLNLIFSTSIFKYIERLFLVIPYIWINVIKPQSAIYITFLLSLFMYIPKQNRVLSSIRSLVLTNLCVIMGGVYFYSIVYEKWQVIGNSVTRMSIFMTPLVLINIAITLFFKYSNFFSDEK